MDSDLILFVGRILLGISYRAYRQGNIVLGEICLGTGRLNVHNGFSSASELLACVFNTLRVSLYMSA